MFFNLMMWFLAGRTSKIQMLKELIRQVITGHLLASTLFPHMSCSPNQIMMSETLIANLCADNFGGDDCDETVVKEKITQAGNEQHVEEEAHVFQNSNIHPSKTPQLRPGRSCLFQFRAGRWRTTSCRGPNLGVGCQLDHPVKTYIRYML